MSEPTTKEDEVFLDAEEEFTTRRSNRKRRSTAGNATPSSTSKKLKPGKKMPVGRSPEGSGGAAGARKEASPRGGQPNVPGGDQDEFWAKMGGILGGMESRLKQETTGVKEQLAQAIGDLGSRVEKTEKRLDEFAEEVNRLVDKRVASTLMSAGTTTAGLQQERPGLAGVAREACGDGDGQVMEKGMPSSSYAAVLGRGALPKGRNLLEGKIIRNTKEEDYWLCRRTLRLRPILPGLSLIHI